MRTIILLATFLLTLSATPLQAAATKAQRAITNPIMFVTQFPIPNDFAAIGSTFANHRAGVDLSGRGGDLYIRYPDGSLRNLTAEAGFGNAGFQGANAIAVRDPSIHFTGTKAIFSMAIGAPTQQFQQTEHYFQLYEITGFGQGQTISIVKLANQPPDYNNVQPAYLSDGSIVFSTDRPRNGQRHLYPQHDEYESTATPTGLWRLLPSTGELTLLQHAPSGSFDPMLDRSGRIVFTRWDHLQRDQQADASGNPFGNFNFASEAASAATLPISEVFPEPRLTVGTINGHTLNHFLPWTIRPDGTAEEMLNHIGRHELVSYFNRSFSDDNNLREMIGAASGRTNPNALENLFYLSEHPTNDGQFIGIDAPEFATLGSGQIVSINAPPSANPDSILVSYLTPRSTRGTTPAADHSGHYRNPIYLSDGSVLASHTTTIAAASNLGTRANPNSNYQYRLRTMTTAGGTMVPDQLLTTGISKSVSYWDPDVLVSYNGPMWELSAVEVKATTPPVTPAAGLAAPELSAFTAENVNPSQFINDLQQRNLAVIVIRNATARDRADKQQPYNLRIPGGIQNIGSAGRIYDIAHFQIFQGDQVRGINQSTQNPRGTAGRRVIAQELHDSDVLALNIPNPTGPAGSVTIEASDGSVAAFVPTRRALAWQSTATNGTPVVRERFWITLQPGEIRTCDGCHGVNTASQSGAAAATNSPQALRSLLVRWKALQGNLFANGFEN
jgi:hypothetical protein